MSLTFLENGLPWFPSLFFFFEQTVSLPDDSAARQHSRALLSSEPLSARVVDELPVLVEPVTCLLIPAVACGRLFRVSPARGLFFVSGRLERLQLLSQRICLVLRIVALGGERRMRRHLHKAYLFFQIAPFDACGSSLTCHEDMQRAHAANHPHTPTA